MISIVNPLTNPLYGQTPRLKNEGLGEDGIILIPFLCFHSLYAGFLSIKTTLKYLPPSNHKNNNHLFGASTTIMISTRVTMGMNSIETN